MLTKIDAVIISSLKKFNKIMPSGTFLFISTKNGQKLKYQELNNFLAQFFTFRLITLTNIINAKLVYVSYSIKCSAIGYRLK